MKEAKKLLCILVVLILAVYASIFMSYAWLYPVRNSMVLVAGDIHIKVISARYAYAHMTISDTEEIVVDEEGNSFYTLEETKLNSTPVASGENYVIYEFVIKNFSQTKANLSFRLSDFSRYLSDGIVSYESGGTPSVPYASYTAKNILQIKYLKYAYGNIIETPELILVEQPIKSGSSTSLWKYSYGKHIIGGEDAAYEYIKLGEAEEEDDCVTIRFAMDGKIDQESFEAYFTWLTSEDEYVWKCCKTLAPEKTDEVITEYLNKVKAGEQNALSEASKATAAGGFQLTVNYFEFAGENIPFEDGIVAGDSSTE